MDNLKELEALILEEQAASYGRTSVAELQHQRDVDINRLTTHSVRTPQEIRERLQGALLLSVEVKAEHCDEEQWRTGVVGAILEGRISILREILDWMAKMPCSQCGNDIVEGAKFCGQCGAAVPTPSCANDA
jgi:hypothetical protein